MIDSDYISFFNMDAFAHVPKILRHRTAPVNVFNTKDVSHWFPDMWVPIVLLHVPKNGFWPKSGQILPKTGQILAFLAHVIQCPTKKQCKQDTYLLNL